MVRRCFFTRARSRLPGRCADRLRELGRPMFGSASLLITLPAFPPAPSPNNLVTRTNPPTTLLRAFPHDREPGFPLRRRSEQLPIGIARCLNQHGALSAPLG